MSGFIGRTTDNIINGLKNSSTSLPVMIGVVLAIAFIAMLIVTVFTLISIKKAEMKSKKVIDLPPSAMQDDDENKDFELNDDQNAKELPHVGELINRFLITKGYIRVHGIVKSFFKALDFLKFSLGSGYKYKLPWFMIIGAEESGKSSLLEGFTSNGIMDDEKQHSDCVWWFLKEGVVLDVKGEDFILKDGCSANEKNWSMVLSMLSRYRSEKPLNGIILTIPATELYGKTKKSSEEIKKRALYISRKLNFAQNYIGLRVPVYVVVTKTDVVPGFQSFCSEIPVRNRNNMLGWSSPFSLDSMYNSSWIDEAFDFLEDELNEIRMEIFAESGVTTTVDGVFVFPSELLTIRESLRLYIDSIFKSSSIEEKFYFRGVYFTGDSKMVPLLSFDDANTQNQGTMAIMGTPDADINEAGSLTPSFRNEEFAPKKIFFFEDLLLKKIFMEDGIAVPMKSKVYQANKSVFLAKVSTVAFVVIGSYGLFNAKDNLRQMKDNLYPSLFKISSMIKDVSSLTLKNLEDNGNEVLAECTGQLLMMMQQLNNARFSSVFVPASWFSSINKDLTETLRVSYQRVVVRTIYMSLILKARSLLGLKPSLENSSKSIGEVLNPYRSKEYLLMKSYIDGLIELEKHIKKFDSLRTSGDPKDLSDLIDYTFEGGLPKEFVSNYSQYRRILMNTPFPPIDLSPYKKNAYEILINLFQNFLDTIFTNRSKQSLINFLNGFINQLTKQNIERTPEFDEMRKFSEDLSDVCKELGEEGKTWLDNDVFSPSKDYDNFLDNVELLFGKEVAQNLLDITAVNFGYLKAKMQEFNSMLETEIASNRKIKANVDKKKESLPVSYGVFTIEKALSALFKEPYMIKAPNYSLITDIPEGKMIFWDDELVQYAYDMGKSFDEFFTTKVKHFPKSMQEGITLLAKSNLYAVIAGTIAKAQSFVDEPGALTDELSAEEILQKQISELKGVAPKFVSLMKILRGDKLSFVFSDLRTILNKIAFSLLTHIDTLLENQKPYFPHNMTFSYWDGNTGAGYIAYGASDNDELTSYLQLQRRNIYRLALEFAEPVVQFLNSEDIFDQNFGNHSQLMKWTKIVENVDALKKKDPMNSVSLIEKFIRKTLNTYDLDNITSLIQLKDVKGDSSDYFLSVIKQIKKSILSKAEVLIRKRNVKRYNMLRDYYKKHLENKFPFSNYDKSQRVSVDADIDAVREFFKMYDEFGGNPEKILDQIYQLGADSKSNYDFLKKIHDIRVFFGDFLNTKYDTLKVRLEMNFEINKREETNTDYLVDRIFKPNNDASIEFISPDKSATWYFGDPVELDLRWASDDDQTAQTPTYDSNDPDIIIESSKARIQCVGNWSVLRFLQKYKSETGNNDQASANETVLCFKIPLNNGKIAKVYAGVTASLPKKPMDASVTTVKLPRTPEEMPEISREVLAVLEQSVLIEKSETSGVIDQDDEVVDIEEEDNDNVEEKSTKQKTGNKSLKSKQKEKQTKKQENVKNEQNIKTQKENKQENNDESKEVIDILESDEVPSIEDEDESLIQINEEAIE